MTWNAHRIHYDPEYARSEGHPGAVVQQHLHGALIQRLLLDVAGTNGELTYLSWRNVGRGVAGQTLLVEGEVTSVEDGRVEFDVVTRTDEDVCAEGTAAGELH